MTFSIHRLVNFCRVSTAAIAMLAIVPSQVHAQNHQQCMAQANTALEQALCELRKLNPNAALPNIEEFKKNAPRIQHLLLKREAQHFGIALPEVTKQKPAGKASPSLNNKTERDTAGGQALEKTSARISKKASLAGCTLLNEHIRCQKQRYELVKNKKNNQLKAEAFSSHNELIFGEKAESHYASQSDFQYLSAIYPIYIYKMLDIGLGDSTMSFTKFATVYWQSKKDNSGFSERFRRIYNQLKVEKSRNQIQGRYSDTLPENIDSCMRMDSKIIICDNKHQNWVYKLL